ncbi:hypothetical protein CK203_067542 [Vitis vinifera]|uniref:Uncharacterized protein n=1 Tax=Vitis vinifera TaxID=29760 RepID=A0A438EBS5_VITVI|nr:hypothetical protein CK203_067542 [Vitis vinifera]
MSILPAQNQGSTSSSSAAPSQNPNLDHGILFQPHPSPLSRSPPSLPSHVQNLASLHISDSESSVASSDDVSGEGSYLAFNVFRGRLLSVSEQPPGELIDHDKNALWKEYMGIGLKAKEYFKELLCASSNGSMFTKNACGWFVLFSAVLNKTVLFSAELNKTLEVVLVLPDFPYFKVLEIEKYKKEP